MKQNYNYCLQELLKDEGGYTNDPKDPGGPTNFGITLTDYRKYINPTGTALDVKSMTVDQAKAIYKPKYWDAVNADNLPSGVDYTVFDYGVNSGVSRANKIYTKFKGNDVVHTITLINDERLSFLQSLPTWGRFGKGWGTRVANVRSKSIKLTQAPAATSSAGTPIVATAVAGAAGAGLLHSLPNHFTAIAVTLGVLGLIGFGIFIYEKYKHAKSNQVNVSVN